MPREETDMATEEDNSVVEKAARLLRRIDGRGKKRKRREPDFDENPSNRTTHVEQSKIGSPLKGTLSGPPETSVSSNTSPATPRRNPFSLASVKSPFSGANTPPDRRPKDTRENSSSPLSSKRVVQFNELDISDDDLDYSPPSKRKGILSSPRHTLSPNGTLASPKKVSNREKLSVRKRDLEEERRRLPIWTGILSAFCYLLQPVNHC